MNERAVFEMPLCTAGDEWRPMGKDDFALIAETVNRMNASCPWLLLFPVQCYCTGLEVRQRRDTFAYILMQRLRKYPSTAQS